MDEPNPADSNMPESDIQEVIVLEEGNAPGGASDDEAIEMDTDQAFDSEQMASGSANGSGSADPIVDKALLTFRSHTGEIFSVDLGANNCACTGGEDDRALIWDLYSGRVLFECTGHKDSVVAVKYNSKKNLLATADLCGVIQVWDMQNFSRLQLFEMGCDLEWLLWHHSADILLCGGRDSAVWMWLAPSGNCKIYSGHGPTCSTACLLPDGKQLCAGYADGVVKIWNLKENTSVNVSGASCHTNSVTCICCNADNNIGASGSEDGTVNLFHVSNGKLIESIVCAKRRASAPTTVEQDEDFCPQSANSTDTSISVEAIAFSTVSQLLAIGTVTGDLLLWDTGARQIRQCFRHPDGVVKVVWIDDLIISACLDGQLRLWDSRSGSLVSQWSGHRKEILDFTLTSDKQRVVTVSGDQTAKIFSLEIEH